MTSFSDVVAATSEDVEAFLTLVPASALGTGWTRENLEKELSLEHSRVVVIRDSESCEPAALMVYWVLPDGLELLNVYTREIHRRSGLGRAMVAHLIATADAMKREAVFLDVRASNQAALNLYAAMGFLEAGRRKGYYDGGGEDAILMRWEPLADLEPGR